MTKRQIAHEIKKTYFNISEPYSYTTPYDLYKYLKKKVKNIKLKDVENFLFKEASYTKHKQAKLRFPRRKTVVSKINQQWQLDLADLKSISRQNNGYKYILFAIDILSRKLYTRPLKNKRPSEVSKAFKHILKTSKNKPYAIVSDHGSEFIAKSFQKMLQENKIAFFLVYGPKKASIVERVQRTIKTKMFRYFTAKNTLKYIDILQDLTNSYNKKIHGSIGMAPNSVNESNEDKVKENLYGAYEKKKKNILSLSIGDFVRKYNKKNIFHKGYLPHFSDDIYEIVNVHKTTPPTFTISDENGIKLKQRFYVNELSKVLKT